MKSLFLGVAVLAAPVFATADTFDVYGHWLTQAGDAHIEITDC